jgi:hypothetical protein
MKELEKEPTKSGISTDDVSHLSMDKSGITNARDPIIITVIAL